MSDPAVAAQRQQQRQQGLIASLVTLPFRFFGVLCGALLLCILIECVGMHFFWPEQGWRHAQGMLHYELDRNRSLSGVLFQPAPARNNPSHIHQGGAGSDQGDSDQQQVAAA